MIVKLHTQGLQTLEQIRAFLAGAAGLDFKAPARDEAYAWIAAALRQLGYSRLAKPDKGVVIQYLCKVTGFSRQQMTRLIGQFRGSGRIRDRRGKPAKPFARRYLPEDIGLLAEVDALHGTLSGPATRKLCERAYHVFAEARFERLAGISNGALYLLRKTERYRELRGHYDKTRPARVNIGERRKPYPEGRPGFLRVDSVHQGDMDGVKGLYLINAVDEVTQYQMVCAVEKISERFLMPVLKALIAAFPFTIQGFHSDNGSEYINRTVARLLEKLRIEQTKSRARQSNDNALVESKNGSTLRKCLGYTHIPGRFAQPVNAFTQQVLSPYLNFHRPCLFPIERIDEKGKRRKHYPYENLMTPYDKLKSLPNAASFLKPGQSFELLDALAYQLSDNEAARALNQARTELFHFINHTQVHAA